MVSRAKTVTVKCKRCKTEFEARVADRNRGWGKFCSKSCKATTQEKRTGQYAEMVHKQQKRDNNYRGSNVDKETYLHYQREHGGTPQFSRSGHYQGFSMSPEELSQGGHGDSDWNSPFHEGKL